MNHHQSHGLSPAGSQDFDAAAVVAHFGFPKKQFAASSDTLRIGLVRCGDRGTGAEVRIFPVLYKK